MSKVHKVFVYGTLRPSKEATHRLDDWEMYEYTGAKFSFPYIKLENATGYSYVLGNIIEVDDKGLEALDKYENVQRQLYEREKVDVWAVVDGKDQSVETELLVEDVWVYVAGPTLLDKSIPSGDWFNR